MPGMAAELKLLALAAVIGLVQLMWAAGAARTQQGLKWAGGSRDEARPVSGMAARLERAFRNFQETFPIFAAAVIVCYLAGKLGGLTLWGSGLYVAMRALYVPIYASGVPILRSAVWAISMAGLVMVIVAAFL